MKHSLNLIPGQPLYDPHMVVFYIISGRFPVILRGLMGQEILCDRLLALTVSHIFLIPQDAQDRIGSPDSSPDRLFPHLIEFFCNPVAVGAADEAVID